MKEHTIAIPRRLDLRASLKRASNLFCSPHAIYMHIDFKDMEWIEPFLLLISILGLLPVC